MTDRIATITIDGIATSILAKEKVFSTGSRGYTVTGKILIDGKRYQMGCNLVEIGSKPGSVKKVGE